MSDLNSPALDDVADADQAAGPPAAPEHDLDVTAFTQEADDE